MLEPIAVMLALVHFGVPLVYYWYAKARWLPEPWNLKVSSEYLPKVSVIIPTYREADLIEARLDNIRSQDYPKELMEVILIDSGSDDGTADLVERWASQHKDVKLKLIREEERRGKARALNHALEYASGDIIVIADADAMWPRDSLREALKWMADPSVGAVSCLKRPASSGPAGIEGGYREYYNLLRVAESKAYSTPIFHGELAAFRKGLIERVGGFPTDIGADDSHMAAKIALMGYRAITPETLWIEERVPKKGYGIWRVRRAQHLIQHFSKLIKLDYEANDMFKRIVRVEFFLHIVNPWILLAAILLFLIDLSFYGSISSLLILILGVAALSLKQYRVWISQQFNLLVASLRNLVTKDIVWSKQAK